jgi:hypothetical protein
MALFIASAFFLIYEIDKTPNYLCINLFDSYFGFLKHRFSKENPQKV